MNLLSRRGKLKLKQFCAKPCVLVFDLDGTLIPLTRDYLYSKMSKSTKNKLTELSNRYPCALLSGRSRKDLKKIIGNIPFQIMVGNHGMEWERPPTQSKKYRSLVKDWTKVLAPLQSISGVEIENKHYSLSIHYRKCRAPQKAVRAFNRLFPFLKNVSMIRGKLLWNLVPKGAPRKGDAFKKMLQSLNLHRGFYAGDDQTDEDVFRLKKTPNYFFVRIGKSKTSQAPFYLSDQKKILPLLEFISEI